MKLSSSEKIRIIAKYKSFSEAAEHMYLSPQAILQHVNTYETDIGFKIFDRSYSGIKLTPAGKLYIDGLNQIHEMHEQIKKQCCAVSQRMECLRLPLINNGPLFYEDLVLPAYKKRYPNVAVNIIPCRAEDIFDCLISEKIDCVHFAKSALKSKDFLFTPITPLKQYCIMSKEHPLAGKKSVSFRDLRTERVYTLSLYMYKLQLELFEKNGVHIIETDLPFKKVCYEHGIYLSTLYRADIPSSFVSLPLQEKFSDELGIISRKRPSQHTVDYINVAKEILAPG